MKLKFFLAVWAFIFCFGLLLLSAQPGGPVGTPYRNIYLMQDPDTNTTCTTQQEVQMWTSVASGKVFTCQNGKISPLTGTNGLPVNNPVFTGTLIGPSISKSSVNGDLNVQAYGATGDCVTDDHNAIMAAFNAAYNANPQLSVVFPTAPGGCYLTSTLTWLGVSFHGVLAGSGYATSVMPSQLRSKPGQDLWNVPDVNDVAIQNPKQNFTVENMDLVVDDSVDSSASHPFRLMGRVITDITTTASSTSILSSTSHAYFKHADVGQNIRIKGAGASGADLLTTIASVQDQNHATLTAPAQTSLAGNGNMYIAVFGDTVTQTAGACGLAWDNRDGNTANWRTAGTGNPGMFNAVWRNVTIRALSQTPQNHSCGIFGQGTGVPYNTLFDGVNVARLWYGQAFTTYQVNTGSQGIGGDFNKWTHAKWDSQNAFLYYDGGRNKIEDIQIASNYGTHIVQTWTPVEYQPSSWLINIPEIELSNAISFRLDGNDHVVINTQLADQTSTAYYEAFDSKCYTCIALNTLVIGGLRNEIYLSDGADKVVPINYSPSNRLYAGRLWNPPNLIEPMKNQQLTPSRMAPAGNKTADFIQHSLGSTPYNNDEDLWMWPQEMNVSGTGTGAITFDTASESGANVTVGNSGNLFGNYSLSLLSASGPSIGVIGTQAFPAVKTNAYIRWKCDTAQSVLVTFNAVNNSIPLSTPLNSQSLSCGTSYSTVMITGDATAQSNAGYTYSWNFNYGGSPSVHVAWIALQPWNANQYTTGTSTSNIVNAINGFQINSSYGANGSVPMSNGSGWAYKSSAGSGAALTTGPFSGTVANHFASFVGTNGQIQDSGVANIANVQVTIAATTINAGVCSADLGPVSMPGAVATNPATGFLFSPTSDFSGITGWGAVGGLVFVPWPTTDNLHYKICNQTASNITMGANTTWTVIAK